MSEEEDYWEPPSLHRAIPIGPAAGKPVGVQPMELDPFKGKEVPREHYRTDAQPGEPPASYFNSHHTPATVRDTPARSTAGKKAWETRRRNAQDRHAVGEHPYDAALAALYEERARIDTAIELLEKIKGRA